MSTATTAPEGATVEAHEEEHEHPSNAKYWKVGALLGVITAAEVSTYFITNDPYSHDLKPLLIGGLLVMMVAKFVTIAGYFMHLKFDNKLFRVAFIAGLALAVAVYLIVLGVFTFFDSSYEASLGALRT